ncbi:MAG: rod shape-determining protein MreC [Zoogloeaceae bacterium]|nr:rod shape-determining protein MreC [Zoogloeaceae bacterium]
MPLTVLFFYIALAVALFVLDFRFHAIGFLRQGIFVLTVPLQRLSQVPKNFLLESKRYFYTLDSARTETERLKAAALVAALDLNRVTQLKSENDNLRALLELRRREKVGGQAANVLYTARDPFSRRVYIDKGSQQGIREGLPVIDSKGIIGQITFTFPFSSEVTLLTDKSQAIPVQIERTGQRSITFGLGNGQVELRYMPSNADVVIGDILHTSGLDGIYPAGFQVARVTQVARDNAYAFARIVAMPLADVEGHNLVMVLDIQEKSPLPVEQKNAENREDY